VHEDGRVNTGTMSHNNTFATCLALGFGGSADFALFHCFNFSSIFLYFNSFFYT
jgi:hypothetical protein